VGEREKERKREKERERERKRERERERESRLQGPFFLRLIIQHHARPGTTLNRATSGGAGHGGGSRGGSGGGGGIFCGVLFGTPSSFFGC
jgi:hypothetical protein